MKKQISYIVIAGVLLAVLIGALVFLLTLPDKEDDSSSTSTDTTTTLIEQATSNIEKIVVDNSGGKYTLMGYDAKVESTIESSGETSTVTTTEMIFTMQGYDKYTVDKDKSDSLAYDCSNLISSRTVNSKNNPDSDYGLDNPRATVTVSFLDGSEKTIKVGNDIPGGESAYIRIGDESKIYVVSLDSIESMLVEKLQMFDKTIIGSLDDNETLDSISVSGSARKSALTIERNSFSSISEYYISSPISAACDNDEIESLRDYTLFPFVADSVAAIEVTENDLSKYNLDEPYYILDTKTSSHSYKLLVSEPDDDKNCYIMAEGDKIIYQVESSTINFMSYDGNEIVSDTIFYPNELMLDSTVISYGKTNDEYTLTHTTTKNNKDADVTTTEIILGKTNIKASLFSKFMKNLSILNRAEKIPEYDEKSDPILSVAVTYTNKTVDTLVIYEGEKKAIVVLDGEAVGTVELEKAKQLLNCAKTLAANSDFDSLAEDETETSETSETSESNGVSE